MPILSAEELAEKLSVAVERLKDALKPTAVYLYGSYADGTADRPRPFRLGLAAPGAGREAVPGHRFSLEEFPEQTDVLSTVS